MVQKKTEKVCRRLCRGTTNGTNLAKQDGGMSGRALEKPGKDGVPTHFMPVLSDRE